MSHPSTTARNRSGHTVGAAPTAMRRHEITLRTAAPEHPFTVALHAEVTGPDRTIRIPGFYDGDGMFRLRHLPLTPGTYSFRTVSDLADLHGQEGTFDVGPARPNDHGPVRVAGFHLAHADGAAHLPIGTTAYAWTHQPEHLQESTLASLRAAPFTKLRMCVFPKWYQFNHDEPERFPFEGDGDGGFAFDRFDVTFWQHLEARIDDLADIGVQADLILFHPYDRWGFATMTSDQDDAYLRYAVARLAAFPNVWWSLANEYDLLKSKTPEDWERFAAIIGEEDSVGHLLSVHNCWEVYDHSRPWVSHASMQRVDLYKTAEMVTDWRERWGKPVIVDECGYEGDIDQGWGNLTAEEMLRRTWEGAVRGGYVGHGETYLADDEVLWWSKGGTLKGQSPERIGFLRKLLEEAPGPVEPLPGDWDAPRAGVPDQHVLVYLGFNRPRFRTFRTDPGTSWHVDIIDTWGMTVQTLPTPQEGTFRVDLPARPYMAIRLRAA
ncbi:DUF5605 domain-containing protein [Ruania halotolerans]|uniref:DUF5605 domain-containing protein n=1 Tax=Ruania halotolerans TaxID=2897773 RepID=UPI001E38B2D4|nr:DUF5605 domain-containing protein [Ruania halotolerans]UFU06977.1 DUF5605 domain-containing protein [Ruania halotolerans]